MLDARCLGECAHGRGALGVVLATGLFLGCSATEPLELLGLSVDPEQAGFGSVLSIELVASREAPEVPTVTVGGEDASVVGYTHGEGETTVYYFSYEVSGDEREGRVSVVAVARDEKGAEATIARTVTFAFAEVELLFPHRTWTDDPRNLDVEILGTGFRPGQTVVWDAGGVEAELEPSIVEPTRLTVTIPAAVRLGGQREVAVRVQSEGGARSAPLTFIIGGVLPDTGQTDCYDEGQGVISCPAWGSLHGQDAQYGWDLLFDPAHEPGKRFTTFGSDAVILDRMTLLKWQNCVSGRRGAECEDGAELSMPWQEALDYCGSLEWGGHNEWRLPTIEELSTIVDIGSFNPSANADVFPRTPNGYHLWASTHSVMWSFLSWGVQFFSGAVAGNDKQREGYVRCVHGGDALAKAALERSTVERGQPVVRDSNSGLIWQGCSAGQEGDECLGAPFLADWKHSLAYCNELVWAGYEDWRLPSRNELQSIVRYDLPEPAIDSLAFPAMPDEHWCSSTFASDPTEAWFGRLSSGVFLHDSKMIIRHVRCVRGGVLPN